MKNPGHQGHHEHQYDGGYGIVSRFQTLGIVFRVLVFLLPPLPLMVGSEKEKDHSQNPKSCKNGRHNVLKVQQGIEPQSDPSTFLLIQVSTTAAARADMTSAEMTQKAIFSRFP